MSTRMLYTWYKLQIGQWLSVLNAHSYCCPNSSPRSCSARLMGPRTHFDCFGRVFWVQSIRPRWLASSRLSSCLLKSILWVHFSPSAHTCWDFFLHKNWWAESARAWGSNIRWKSTSSGNAEPYARRNIEGTYRGGERDDTCEHGLSRSWEVKLNQKKKKKNGPHGR